VLNPDEYKENICFEILVFWLVALRGWLIELNVSKKYITFVFKDSLTVKR
jgi:hypothetical protein